MLTEDNLKKLLEAVLLVAGKPMTEEQLLEIFGEEERPAMGLLKEAIVGLQQDFDDRAIELVRVASGYRFQVKSEWAPWMGRLWEEKAQKYSRSLLETLALIAYRQPITRGEIEDIRGVAVSTTTIKTLMDEREWVRVVGHKEVPGRPALYATTKHFLDYFGLKHLQDLPALPEIMDLDNFNLEVPAIEVLSEEISEASIEMIDAES